MEPARSPANVIMNNRANTNISRATLTGYTTTMNADWNTFLQQAGAAIIDGVVAGRVRDFGQPVDELQAPNNGNILADVSHMGLIAVQGADAATFLQGQLTNDIREVSATHSQISAYCSPKGRMLACMRIFMRDDTYYLGLPRDILDATLQRLRMFVLRAKVTLSDASDTLVYIGYAGERAAATLEVALGAIPANVNDVTQGNGLTVLRLPGSVPRFGIIGEVAAIQTLWNTLRVSAQPVGANVWDLLDIRAGIPTVYAATRDAFVPQMANLDTIGGISFKKGCYTGQEIVARMHYLGTLKRRMFLAKVIADVAPQPGDALYASGTDDAQGCVSVAGGRMPGAANVQSIGTVVTAQRVSRGEYAALAVVDIKSAATGQIHLYTVTGTALTFIPLPYTPE